MSGIIRDISEQRAAGEVRALLALIVESSDDAIFALTLDGTIVSWNHGAEAHLGYSSQEIVGSAAGILLAPGRADEMSRCLDTVRNGSRVHPYDTLFRNREGRGIEVSLMVSPIWGPGGEVAGASAHDIATHGMAIGRREHSS